MIFFCYVVPILRIEGIVKYFGSIALQTFFIICFGGKSHKALQIAKGLYLAEDTLFFFNICDIFQNAFSYLKKWGFEKMAS